MRLRSLIAYLLLTSVFIGVTAITYAGSTGKIVGTITDAETGDPVIGASVMLDGTRRGAMTDFDGNYVIANVKPGTYSVRISHLDYATVTVTDVIVKADMNTEVSYQLEKKVSDLDVEISVRDKRDILQIREVSNEITISREAIQGRPVSTVADLQAEASGVVTNDEGMIFIRGSRAFEVAYVVDGVPLGDPLGGLGQAGANLSLVTGNTQREGASYRSSDDGLVEVTVVRDGSDPKGKDKTFQRYLVTPECRDILIATGPAHGGTAIVNGEAFDAMFFKNYGINPFVDTEDDHLSTFAIDVDDASYTMTRSYLDRGALPPNEAIRTEEFINHFRYNYTAPHEETFELFMEGSPSKFGQNCQMLRIGIKGQEINPEERKPANLVFVIDVSGSMAREHRLELVKKALRFLLDELRADDRVGICVYGTHGKVILEPTSIKYKYKIVSAIEELHPHGSTFAEEGIRLGYEMADRHFQKGKINRIILCSDGVANVGRTGADDILKMIKQYADKGVTLSSIGFGMGNYNDILLEKLGNKGNGYYAYVDDIGEARKIFVDNLTGNLQVIARDVKIQVDFNPEVVRSYRLLGYENRDVEDNKFRDDKEDGGEIGSGHEVTALYEIKLKEDATSDLLGTVFVRYKDPDDMRKVTEINRSIEREVFKPGFEDCSHEYRLAACAAEFAEILRRSYWARGSNMGDVLKLARNLSNESDSPELIELMGLISKAKEMEQELANR
ncbi:MAG: von Willebrand factor type A domain-containing protein [Candidatus Zixiibacteriota bacterium]|nr:MAG: von Willebrand factor type A domain-containing protein [candidate division Zixibacteria bacterium]